MFLRHTYFKHTHTHTYTHTHTHTHTHTRKTTHNISTKVQSFYITIRIFFCTQFTSTRLTFYRTYQSLSGIKLVLLAQSTTKYYIRAERKLHSTSMLFISQVIIPQVMFFEPIYIPQVLNTGTCIQQGDLFYSAGPHRNRR